MGNYRFLGAMLATAIALPASIYLAGYLALVFLGLDAGMAGFGTYPGYLRHFDHPQVAPYAWRIAAAGGIGFGLVLLAWAAVLVVLFKLRSHHDIHGRARFAGLLDLARAGFLGRRDDGIVVGRKNGKLLRLSGQQFVILAAPTRSGKGVGVVVP